MMTDFSKSDLPLLRFKQSESHLKNQNCYNNLKYSSTSILNEEILDSDIYFISTVVVSSNLRYIPALTEK